VSSIVSALTGSNRGSSFTANQADLQTPATTDQANAQYGNVNQGLLGQQNLLGALQAQQGLQNQSSVFNQQQGIANGTGPNPAQAMLANSTGQNVANQAALMAGQRGSGQNAGLMARQAGMQGANIQQQAAGQGAAMQANQSLNALNQMGGIAGQQASNQIGAANQFTNNALGAQQNVLGAIGSNNNARVSNSQQANSANAHIAHGVSTQQGNILGGVLGGLGSAAQMIPGMMGGSGDGGGLSSGDNASGNGGGTSGPGQVPMANPFAKGGMVPKKYADGGEVDQQSGPRSNIGKAFYNPSNSQVLAPVQQAPEEAEAAPQSQGSSGPNPMQLAQMAMMFAAHGGKVPAMVSPGERYLSPDKVEAVKQGANPIKVGEKIPGKPAVGGAKNSYANDTVPKTLDAGGIVIPRSITQGKNAPKKAAEFVAAVLRKQSK